MENAANNTLTK